MGWTAVALSVSEVEVYTRQKSGRRRSSQSQLLLGGDAKIRLVVSLTS